VVLTVVPRLALGSSSGHVGTTLTFEGAGFAGSAEVWLTWAEGTICTTTTSDVGSFSCGFAVPAQAAGTYTFEGTDAASNTASVSFKITSQLTSRPTSAPIGTVVAFLGTGYAGDSMVTVNWTHGTACAAAANSLGNFTCSFTLPRASYGNYTFNATDASGHSADATFMVITPAVIFTEAGLPSGATWSVALDGSVVNTTSSWAIIHEPSGTYEFMVRGPTGYLDLGSPPVGNVTVSATNVSEAFSFAKGTTRALTFVEVGLIPGTTWCATVGYALCSNRASIPFANLTPWAYPYTVEAVPGYSAAVKVGGVAVPANSTIGLLRGSETVTTTFSPVLYSAAFEPVGLAGTLTWHVSATCTVPKKSDSSCYGMAASGAAKDSAVTLELRNGTYTWKVTAIKGYRLEVNGIFGWSGTASVSGAGVVVPLQFAQVLYNVTFTETGLAGQSWTVYVNGTEFQFTNRTETTTETSFTLTGLPNGTYSVKIVAPTGYTFVSPKHGSESVKVNGKALTVTVRFKDPPRVVSNRGTIGSVPFMERGD
jgi:hypothetical protein